MCRQGRGQPLWDGCVWSHPGWSGDAWCHTQDEVGMHDEITSPEALRVSHWQDLTKVRPLRSRGALNSTSHIPFCSPSSDSSARPHSMHCWYPRIMSSSNTRSCQINLSNISCDSHILSLPRPLKFGLRSSFSWTIPTASYLVFLCHSGLSRGCLTPQVLRACQRRINLHANDTSSYL